jgi:hypothetical protein
LDQLPISQAIGGGTSSRRGRLVFFGVVVLMRWLVIGLLVSVVALLLVAGAVARHVWRQRRLLTEDPANVDLQKERNPDLDLALELHDATESKDISRVEG